MSSVRVIDSYRFSRSLFNLSNIRLYVAGDARPFLDLSLSKKPVTNYHAKCTLSAGKIAFAADTASGIYVNGNDSAWQFGTGSWFISAKVACNYGGASAYIMVNNPATAGVLGWQMGVQNGTRAPFMIIEGTTYGLGTPAANLLMSNNPVTETTMSFGYDGTTLRCFVDGALSWSLVVALNIDTGAALCLGNRMVGGLPNSDALATLTIREAIVVGGETLIAPFIVPAVWAITGVVLESWFPASYANVKLNMHMSGANGGVLFPDTSSGAKAATVNGNAQTSTAQFRVGNSSGLFDGTGDFVTYPDSADWDFGVGDYNLDIQVRTTNNAKAAQVLFAQFNGAGTAGIAVQLLSPVSGSARILLLGNSDNVFDSDGHVGTSYIPFANNTWVHLRHSRISGDNRIFIEGELIYSQTDAVNMTGSAEAWTIARLTTASTAQDFVGNLQEHRVVKGEGCPRSFIQQASPWPDS